MAIHATVDGQWKLINGKLKFSDNWKFIDDWKDGLSKSGRQADVDLLSNMKGERDEDVHGHGASLVVTMEWIPVTEFIGTDRSHPAYGFHWFEPPSTEPPKVGRPEVRRPVYSFRGSGDDVLEAARRYLDLLEEFVKAYNAAHP